MCRISKRMLMVLLLAVIFLFTGCDSQTINKEDSYAEVKYECMPMDTGNGTRIEYHITIKNETIFNMKDIRYRLDLYENNVFLKTIDYIDIDATVKHGASRSFKGIYVAENLNVTEVKINNWYSEYLGFKETYSVWMIVISAITIVCSIIYAIWIFVEDATIDEVWDNVFEFNWSIVLLFCYLTFTAMSPLPDIGWVPLCLSLAALVIFILIGLLLHLIQLIVWYFGGFCFKKDKNMAKYLATNVKITDMTKNELIEYCQENGIEGYSKLNKQDLINLISCYKKGKKRPDNYKSKSMPRSRTPKSKRITFASIAGLEEAKKAFEEKVILPFKHPEIFEKYHKKSGGGILLYGLPGTGKTMFAEACSNEVDALFIPIKCSDIKSKWYGESEQKVKTIFARARRAERAIIFFDEFEAIGAKRTDDSNNGNNDLVPQILAEMQGIGNANLSTVIVIAATNKPWSIDSAFLRPGRFDEKIYIPLPDYEARLKMFGIYLNNLPQEEDLDIKHLAEITEGFNGADIKEVCEKIKMVGITKSLESGDEYKINNIDILNIESAFKSSVMQEDILYLEEFKNS